MAMSRFVLLAGCSIAVAVGSSVYAQEPSPTPAPTSTSVDHDDDDIWHFKVYGGPAYVAPLNDSDVSFETVTDSLQAQSHVGWNLGVEGRFARLIGIELDYVNGSQDVEFGGTTIGETDFSPLTLTANFHLIPSNRFDFYVGPSFTWVNWGDIELDANGSDVVGDGFNAGLDSETGWGISTGLDIGFGEHFAIGAGLKWLNVGMVLSDGQEIDVEPLIARLTAAFRF
jgi:hypothetical protein